MPPTVRLTNLLVFLATAGMMAVALYMEHVMGLAPCPLCVGQRVFVVLVGVWALLALAQGPGALGRRIYALLGLLSALAGGAVSGRQLWLQSLPADQVPACGPGLDYLMDTAPFLDVLRVMFTGDGNCAEVVWQFLGLSIPGWTLVGFAGLALLNVWQLMRRDRR